MNKTIIKLIASVALAFIALNILFLFFEGESLVVKAAANPITIKLDNPARPGRHPLLASVLTTTVNDFFLPGIQPGQLTDTLAVPSACDVCHTDPIYNSWRGSMMSQASRDPVMWAALAIANNDTPAAGEYCLRCHVSKGWLEGHSSPPDGSALQPVELEAGVACETCHRLVDPIPSTSDQAVAIDAAIRSQLQISGTLPLTSHQGSAMMIVDPADRRRGPFNVTPPHGALQTDLLNQTSPHVTRSRLCGTCHNVDNPVLSWNPTPPNGAPAQYWPNSMDQAAPSFGKGDLFPIERTFDEWLNSQYATTGVYAPQFAGAKPDGMVGACSDCHMPRLTGKAAEDFVNPVFRDCQTTGCLPEHEFVGGNTWAPQLLQDTRWRLNSVNLKAYDAGANLVFESGAYDLATGVLTQDVNVKIYEAKFGLTPELAAVAGLPSGESFHFVLNNTVLKDNHIPPRGYTQAAYNQPGLRPVGATYGDGQYWDDTVYPVPTQTSQVVATLYYQTSSKEYIDFLRSYSNPDNITLGTLWDTLKSPPEVMATATFPSSLYLPIILK
ncbi:MAG: hypothetical protein HYR94_01710 [Chloroflexi bacterium]|nr:hypothetical protein [Chloroflexota bacterium]